MVVISEIVVDIFGFHRLTGTKRLTMTVGAAGVHHAVTCAAGAAEVAATVEAAIAGKTTHSAAPTLDAATYETVFRWRCDWLVGLRGERHKIGNIRPGFSQTFHPVRNRLTRMG